MNLRQAVLTIALVVLTMGTSLGQHIAAAVQTQSASVPTEHIVGATIQPAAPIAIQKVESIQTAAMRDRIAASLTAAAASIQSTTAITVDDLVKSGTSRFTASAGGESLPVTEQHLLNVVAKYDARPIGGILTVRVELVPAFSGIGIACRPVVSKQFSRAVDNLDDETIASTIKELTAALGEQYAAK